MTEKNLQKLRILCLHGFRTNGAILKFQCRDFVRTLSDKAEFVFVDAPFKARGPPEQIIKKLFPSEEVREWWNKNITTGKYEGAIESIKYIESLGNFDGVLGFSQGACLAELLLAYQNKNKTKTTFKFGIINCGFHPKDETFRKIIEEVSPMKIPVIICRGENDYDGCVETLFEHPIVTKHNAGHMLPTVRNAGEEWFYNCDRRFSVYTKMGDGGSSSLFNLEKRVKYDSAFSALGDTDELNAHVGLAREYCSLKNLGLDDKLAEIQSRLMDIGSAIATPLDSSTEKQLKRAKFVGTEHVSNLEKWIDEMDSALPPITNFILPSGGLAAAQLHVARTTCRRAERSATKLIQEGKTCSDVGIYLNRLSDYFFVAARFACMKSNEKEVIYRKAKEV
eukprot:g1521.t1